MEALLLTWGALHDRPPPRRGELHVRPLEGSGCPAFAAVDHEGRGHLLLRATTLGPDVTGHLGVAISNRTLDVGRAGRGTFVDIVCEDGALLDVFDQYIFAVLGECSSDEHPGATAARILEDWKRFLAPGERPLTAAALQPIFAELLVLFDASAMGNPCPAWRGVGARHDFVRGGTALEVKSTRAHTHRRVSIHGIDQLESPRDGRLFLEFVRLEEVVDSGSSVADLVEAVVDRGVPASSVYEALHRGGLAAGDLGKTRRIRFAVRERDLFEVDGTFPRLTSASFVEGAPPEGVDEINYQVDLTHVASRRLDAQATDSVYRDLAGG